MWMDHCISHFLPPTFFFFFPQNNTSTPTRKQSLIVGDSLRTVQEVISDSEVIFHIFSREADLSFSAAALCSCLQPTDESSSVLIIQSFPNWFTVKVDTKLKSLPTLFLWQSLKSQEMILLIKDLHE